MARLYRGRYESPLEYFLENFDEYKGMSRTQLSSYDPGLYRSLVRHNQIEKAIHTDQKYIYKRLYPSDIKKILKAYTTYDGNALKASQKLPYSRKSFLKYWRRAGLEIRKRGRQK